MSRLVALSMIVLCGLAQLAQAAQPIAVVPYRTDYDGALTVSVTINGRGPYDFIVDTGATLTLAFENLAAIEKFEPTGRGPRRVLGITGSDWLDTFKFGNLNIGPASLPDHVGVIVPDWGGSRKTPAGIIGIDFLRRYAIAFDVREKTMSLYPHGQLPKDLVSGWTAVPVRAQTYAAASGALYTAKGAINRSQTTFIIDLGSVTTLINYRAAEAIYASTISTSLSEGLTTGSRLKDLFDDRTTLRTARLNRIQLGRRSWKSTPVWIYNAPIFDEIGVQHLSVGLLGLDVLTAQDLALDFGENRLYIAKKSR